MYVENNNKGMYYYVAAYNNTQVQLAQKAKHCGAAAAGCCRPFFLISGCELHAVPSTLPPAQFLLALNLYIRMSVGIICT
jgi:hypothetical protein